MLASQISSLIPLGFIKFNEVHSIVESSLSFFFKMILILSCIFILMFLKLKFFIQSSVEFLLLSLVLFFCFFNSFHELVVYSILSKYGIPKTKEWRKVANVMWVMEVVIRSWSGKWNESVRRPRELISTVPV